MNQQKHFYKQLNNKYQIEKKKADSNNFILLIRSQISISVQVGFIIIPMTQSARHPSISNINYCAKLSEPIDLDRLTKCWFESQHIVYTLLPIPRVLVYYDNGIAVNISPQGAIVILGKISPNDAEKIVHSLTKKICMYLKKKLSFSEQPRVASLMGSAKLPFQINFDSLIQKVSKCNRSKKNPGIWWKIQKYGIQTVGIFSSGSLQLCGAKSMQDLQEAYEKLEKLLYQFRRMN